MSTGALMVLGFCLGAIMFSCWIIILLLQKILEQLRGLNIDLTIMQRRRYHD